MQMTPACLNQQCVFPPCIRNGLSVALSMFVLSEKRPICIFNIWCIRLVCVCVWGCFDVAALWINVLTCNGTLISFFSRDICNVCPGVLFSSPPPCASCVSACVGEVITARHASMILRFEKTPSTLQMTSFFFFLPLLWHAVFFLDLFNSVSNTTTGLFRHRSIHLSNDIPTIPSTIATWLRNKVKHNTTYKNSDTCIQNDLSYAIQNTFVADTRPFP